MKADLRDHDNVVECIEWAPESANPNIAKAAVLDAAAQSGSFLVSGSRDKTIKVLIYKTKIKLIDVNFSLVLGCNFRLMSFHTDWPRQLGSPSQISPKR